MISFVGETKQVEAAYAALRMAVSAKGSALFLDDVFLDWVRSRTSDRFTSEGDEVSGGWVPLERTTVLIRINAGFGPGPINVRTGDMKQWASNSEFAFKPLGHANLSARYPREKPTGKLRDKVRTAQIGEEETGTPPRPILGWGALDLQSLLLLYAQWLNLFIRNPVMFA